MINYYHIKLRVKRFVSSIAGYITRLNHRMNSRKKGKKLMSYVKINHLTSEETVRVKQFFKSRGYNLKHTDWHAYYRTLRGELHESYIPLGLFKSELSPKLNNKLQWPALLDKNLIYRIFSDFNQPTRVVQNINGFYYKNDKVISENEAIKCVTHQTQQLIIKPSIESGGGKKVIVFKVQNGVTSHNDLTVKELLLLYKNDFIIQEFLEQSDAMRLLNPTSLNTLRVISYLNNDGVNILRVAARIGSLDSPIDNYKAGGLLCGVDENGQFGSFGCTNRGDIKEHTFTGVKLSECSVPNFDLVVKMIESMHVKIPYFKMVSWDIAINKDDKPVLIEYNTYNQGLDVQIVTGPLFNEFTDEILKLCKD